MKLLLFLWGIILAGNISTHYLEPRIFTIPEDFMKKCIDAGPGKTLKIIIERNKFDKICLYKNPLCTTGEHFNMVWEKSEWIKMVSCNVQGGCGAKSADISFSDTSCGWEANIADFKYTNYIANYYLAGKGINFEIEFQ